MIITKGTQKVPFFVFGGCSLTGKMLDCESRRCPFKSDLRPSFKMRRIGIVFVPWIANPKTPVRFWDPSPNVRFVKLLFGNAIENFTNKIFRSWWLGETPGLLIREHAKHGPGSNPGSGAKKLGSSIDRTAHFHCAETGLIPVPSTNICSQNNQNVYFGI